MERGVCERLYDRLWRHRSTDDEERDSKLRSKTAALAVVGIGLKELHVDTDSTKDEARQVAGDKKEEIDESLTAAREHILKMNEERNPLGKLMHLTAAHKSIVETLSQLFPSSSSADEVLPTLIYTLITTPAESINAVSNLYFIQRFRAASKMDGEASYCLVNLEAAISFLETVDLSSLRADEVPEGPPKSARTPSFTSSLDKALPPQPLTAIDAAKLEASPTSTTTESRARPDKSPTPSNSSRTSNPQERLNSLIKKADNKIEAGRESFLSGADSAFDTINTTLNDSFKFVFGRLKEQQQHEREIQEQHATIPHDPNRPNAAANSRSPTVIPETLEDARKLVNPPIPPSSDDDTASELSRDAAAIPTSGSTPLFDDPLDANSTAPSKPADAKLLDLVGSRSSPRDRSADSTRSGASSLSDTKKRVAFATPAVGGGAQGPAHAASLVSVSAPPPPPPPATAIDSVRSFGNALNPLQRLGGIGFRGFGRQVAPLQSQPQSQSQPQPQSQPVAVMMGPTATTTTEEPRPKEGVADAVVDGEKAGPGPGVGGSVGVAELKKLLPLPSRRFVEMRDAREMKVGEVEELLREYQRLVTGVQRVVSSA